MVGGSMDGTHNGVSGDLFINMDYFDFPMESLEGDNIDGGHQNAKVQALSPIPSESLLGSSLTSGGNIGNAIQILVPSLSSLANAPSPVSVLDSSSSCSSEKSISMSTDILTAARARSMHSQVSTINPCFLMPSISSTAKRSCHFAASKALSRLRDFPEFDLPSTMICPVKRKLKKEKKLSDLSGADEMIENSSRPPVAAKRCAHCNVTNTPQWREGPTGSKTLCNACGVRYRSGRLFPEYRPATSPTFVPSLHSNLHNKVVEMRNKAIEEVAMSETKPPMSPPLKAIHEAAVPEIEPSGSPPYKTIQEATMNEPEPPVSPPHKYIYEAPMAETETSISPPPKKKKLLCATEMVQNSSQRPNAAKSCSHCEVTKTPQWRDGPMGPKTLCNACGVRYRSGRLFPDYRPAASPTFVPHLHSNSDGKYVEMRNKFIQEPTMAEIEPSMSTRRKAISEAGTAEIKPSMSPSAKKMKLSGDAEMMQNSSRRRVSAKKCSHCELTHIPQSRGEPMGTKTLCNTSGTTQIMRNSSPQPVVTKKCSHCEVTETPQWREGPMGPKTLCNACGVRYRLGRLFPEYRPAASPTFVPSLHSNSHREVVKMRNKTTQEPAMADTYPPTSRRKPTQEASHVRGRTSYVATTGVHSNE
ncbi:biofilm regulator 1-like isoform X1 [Actinidia eriantha]|uniref:biofilm regulator 1-like isoform X1 n=2 Tax=Actinidia eriantha TaxID=165200 RepID=UPI00258BD0E7|nr:biofilm regulator 1-like isoform X1 [Actinidia eriantha]XP_057474509.1 biofilm regulator 1-like isoform X1 [Actinidia eriantha]